MISKESVKKNKALAEDLDFLLVVDLGGGLGGRGRKVGVDVVVTRLRITRTG